MWDAKHDFNKSLAALENTHNCSCRPQCEMAVIVILRHANKVNEYFVSRVIQSHSQI